MKKNKGNSIAQYAMLIALLALAIIPAYLIMGKNIVESLSNFYNALPNNEASANNTNNSITLPLSTSPTIEPGSLNGKPESPVADCKKGACQIDYGTFVLSGIPDDFQEVAGSAGSSISTEQLANLLDIIAENAKNSDLTPEELQILKDLANKGHELAGMEGSIESAFSDFLGYMESNMQCRYYTDNFVQAGTEFNTLLTSLNEKKSTITNPATLNLLKTAEVLSNEISSMQTETFDYVGDFMGEISTQRMALPTEPTEADYNSIRETLTSIKELDASKRTDLDSTIICGMGKYSDSERTCK